MQALRILWQCGPRRGKVERCHLLTMWRKAHEVGKFTIRNVNWEFGRPVLGLIFHLESCNATELANQARVNESIRTLTTEVGVI